jgi:membrane-associated phospholipid phosphatase
VLLAHPHAEGSFAQVSAFASLHVGVTFVIVLMASYFRLRRTTRVLTVFLGCTMLATIYLGWHFAVDDLAGLAIAWVSVQLGKTLIRPAPTVRLGAGTLAETPAHGNDHR